MIVGNDNMAVLANGQISSGHMIIKEEWIKVSNPEDIKDDEEFITKHSATTFEATVKVYELLGAEVNLHYDIADTTCTAKVNPRTTARPGDVVKFAMDISRLHVFDKETEQIITH